MTAREAVAKFVKDGDELFVSGFGSLYAFALAHEVIRQRRRNLTLVKHSPELIGDQLIGAGCVSKAVFSWIGNPGLGSSHCFRRAVEQGVPHKIELEEFTHAAATAMLRAGATGMSFMATKALFGSDLLKHSSRHKLMECPFTGEPVSLLRALNPDVALIHAQRADSNGNVQAWGVLSDLRDGAFASERVVVSVEELVAEDIVRRDPNRTIIPGFKVDALVVEPWGAHPSACQGYYDRDNQLYIEYHEMTRTVEGFASLLEKFVYSLADRAEYLRKLGPERMARLKPAKYESLPVDYGMYS